MLPRSLLAGVALALMAVLVSGCGGKKRLSASEYRAQLAAIGKEVAPVQANVEKALHAKTMIELRKRLVLFAAAEDRIGDEVAKLRPPKDAQKANDALAKGEHDTADEVRVALDHLSKETSVKAALGYLTTNPNLAQRGREIDAALGQLRTLGYTTGS